MEAHPDIARIARTTVEKGMHRMDKERTEPDAPLYRKRREGRREDRECLHKTNGSRRASKKTKNYIRIPSQERLELWEQSRAHRNSNVEKGRMTSKNAMRAEGEK